MQYGNSFSSGDIHHSTQLFKSYYVVWKLRSMKFLSLRNFSLNRTMQYGNNTEIFSFSFCIVVFKSYYVVWKLFHPSHCSTGAYMFKSYYVVWKLSLPRLFHHRLLGLNRTMQYGNLRENFAHDRSYVCLNRTMQYGNCLAPTTRQDIPRV